MIALLSSSLLSCMSAELSHSIWPITAFVVVPLFRAHVEHIKSAKTPSHVQIEILASFLSGLMLIALVLASIWNHSKTS